MRESQEMALQFFTELFVKQSEGPLSSLRKAYFDKFLSLGLPTRKSDLYQYLPLLRLYENLSHSHSSLEHKLSFSSQEGNSLVFVDGVFSRELSSLPKQVSVLTFEEALKGSYGTPLKHRMQMMLESESDPLALLNGALSSSGILIYIPPKMKIEEPLHMQYLQSSPQAFAFSRVELFMGKDSEASLVTSIEGGFFYNGLFDVSLDEGARLSYTQLPSENSPPSWGFDFLRAGLKKTSKLSSFLSSFGSESLRHDYKVQLLGEEADAELIGIMASGSTHQSHVHVHMEHAAPSCRSQQLFKSILLSQGTSSFTGKIYVKQIAQKTEAYQLNKNLILSDSARAYSKPNLEIFADDVKASHGSTISQLDEDELLYLRTRGIDAQLAKELLTEGFCREVWEKMPHPSSKEKVLAAHKRFMKVSHV